MKEKIKQKGFTKILLFIIVAGLLTVMVFNTNVFLNKNKRLPSLKAAISFVIFPVSEIIYKTVWEKRFEMKELKQEVELSNIKKEQAENRATKEETAREEAEAKTQEETIKRSQAEAKAKQEEFERKLKEQELAEKEAEEKIMNADNDGDGLTYRRELELGTSDWNIDSDGDGIKDNEDLHPAGGGRYQAQTFTWNYGDDTWNWTESIQEDWYGYYKAKPRSSPQSVEYITSDDPFIKKISEVISKGEEKGVNRVWLAVSFVQNLSYVDDVFTGYDEYPKYPVETFFEKNGDCEDTSYLAASIIDAMGYGSVLILLPGHMAVGIYMDCHTSGTYYEFDGRCYYYVETTSKDWAAGEIPDRYRNTRATLIKIPSGETISNINPQYKKPCYASSDFPGYYSDGKSFYSDSQCNNLKYCLPYKEYYINPSEANLYWDSSCSQEVTSGCYKSKDYPGYFYDSFGFYYDSRCSQKAKICRLSSIYSDRYWDGDYSYWDSGCTQKVVSWCYKSDYHPGYFVSSLDYKYYYDYQCTQKADL